MPCRRGRNRSCRRATSSSKDDVDGRGLVKARHTPGAITRNTALPAAAVIFRIGPTRQAVLIRPRSRYRACLHNARSAVSPRPTCGLTMAYFN